MARPNGRYRPERRADPQPEYSGRAFVALAVLAVMVLWGVLHLAHRTWRARYQARAGRAEAQVARAVNPLAGVVPKGIDADEWARAVRQTHAMLVGVVAAVAPDAAGMEALRADLAARVARARPETAAAILTRIWSDMERKAGPALVRSPADRLLPLALATNPLDRAAPPGVSPATWSDALDETRAMLVGLSTSDRVALGRLEWLREQIADRALGVNGGNATATLRWIWDAAEAEDAETVKRYGRPGIVKALRKGTEGRP